NEVWWYPDLDQDAHGDPSAAPVFDCDLSPGATTVDRADDCDDTRADVHPGAVEVCDGADQDCDGPIDDLPAATWFADADHDGFGDPNRSVFEGCPGPDWAMNREDCDDTDPTRFPDAEEVCDGVDQDCDNAVDDVRGSVVWYRDVDGDGHGDGRTGEGFPCPPGDGWAASSDDCDDADPDRWDVCRPDVAKKPVGSPDTGCGCAGGGPAPGAVGVGLSVIALLRRRTIAARA
ncbi:MAG: putative metal-binding motif-containing protein, partial [Myxococcota bacterium]